MTFSFSEAADIATNEACPVPTGICSTCQRSGLPILPLRAAYAPEPWYTQALPLNRGSEVKAVRLRADQPRTLRSGYLYVMLDNREWQAYEISPEGALRQFRPYQVPREEPRSLCEICIQQDHDIPASFINIKTDKYSTAWLALANDPWPESVLNSYLRGGVVDGMALEDRFYKLDLKTARNDPASIGIAMTEADLQMHQVLEYAQPMAGDFHSVHGFYPRNHRLRALAGHVRAVTQEYKLAKGVLALVLPDPVGVVQELNAQRLFRYQAMQEWCAEPQRRFEHFTSLALLGIRQLQVSRAEARAIKEANEAVESRRNYNARPQSYRSPLPSLDLEKEKQRRISEEQTDARERLDERYNEKARKAFEDSYNKTLAAWQRIVDDVAEPYVSQHGSAAFQLAARHDYSITNSDSTEAFIRMLAMCQAGGPTERIATGVSGATQSLWKQQLENPGSLLYRALLTEDRKPLQQFAHDLAGDEQTRAFHGGKTLIGAMEGDKALGMSTKAAVSQLLGAAATASNALGELLSGQARALLTHLHQEAWLHYHGVALTRITVSLKVGEYLTLLNEALYEGTERYIAQLDKQFRKPAERKVRAMLLSNYFAPALASNHAKLIDIVVWTKENTEDLKARLDKLRVGLGDGVDSALRSVSIDGSALKGGMQDFARHLSVNAEAARLLAGDAMRNMRNTVTLGGTGGVNLGLALGSLYFQQDALRRSYQNMLKTIGDEHDEAVAAVMSASVGVMGASVEIVGGTIQLLRPDLEVLITSAGRVQPVGLGSRILQFGGAIVSVASVMEGLQYALAAGRAHRIGDKSAATAYGGAAGIAGLSALAGVIGSVASTTVLLIPLAIAVLLGFVAYGFAVWAKGLESQPLELWARYSRWGLPVEHRRWRDSHDMDTAIGALNAALLGLAADLDVTHRADRQGSKVVGVAGNIEYALVLPGYDPVASSYEWALWAYRPGVVPGAIIAAGRTGDANSPLPAPVSWKQSGSEPDTTAPAIDYDAESKSLEIKGCIAFQGAPDFHALVLEVSYWPDKSDESGMARLIVREDKISGWRWWAASYEKS
ncbi:T6SS effector BTH_I2691 family protein [Pseudomonas sp. Marseille-P9899]|uniref:T6SS effector BTH_I2691 family protein n=1 Tax=Pseudomonas sp. Marseille-P9899 TaxID=2730401 RepID=UPI00158CA17B|nr:T6SS effector BTH_I2691 family protein [Pseudomonas sp. Marseille-P9899]